MKLTDRFNQWSHPLFVRYVCRAYRRKIALVKRQSQELFVPVSEELSAKHRALWGQFGIGCTDDWLRFHVNLTGIADYRFCPEDIFFSQVERILNDCECSGHGVEDKNLLSVYLSGEQDLVPETIVRYIRGAFHDESYLWIDEARVGEILSTDHGDLIGKPCVASSGGSGVERFRFSGRHYRDDRGRELTPDYIRHLGHASYIVQARIVQDPFSARFHADSANTCRIMTLRCPWDGKVVVLKTMMRMGVGGKVVDNMMKGGLCVNIGPDGRFGQYGYNYNGRRYTEHPDSGVVFAGTTHPHYGTMAAAACRIAARVPYFNLLSFDFVPTGEGTVKCVEINATSEGITQLQYDHGGLFGDYSERVVEWCLAHRANDTFSHVRTFYY